jgi:RNA polymerase sigma factor (sigma-70 family)
MAIIGRGYIMDYVEETNKLFYKIKVDPENKIWYRNCIVEKNIKLVPTVLRKYMPYTDDQYQAGCLGLIIAVDTYDATLEVPFSSYACFCIEREIHKQYKKQQKSIETILAKNMIYLDENTTLKNGDTVRKSETIADIMAEESFDEVLEQNDLSLLFQKVITPSVENVASRTGGQHVKIDLEMWKKMELRYILEMAEIESQKARFTLAQMANELNVSLKNIRDRHRRVIAAIKVKCKEEGYDVD